MLHLKVHLKFNWGIKNCSIKKQLKLQTKWILNNFHDLFIQHFMIGVIFHQFISIFCCLNLVKLICIVSLVNSFYANNICFASLCIALMRVFAFDLNVWVLLKQQLSFRSLNIWSWEIKWEHHENFLQANKYIRMLQVCELFLKCCMPQICNFVITKNIKIFIRNISFGSRCYFSCCCCWRGTLFKFLTWKCTLPSVYCVRCTHKA